jgi:hypothetical protein
MRLKMSFSSAWFSSESTCDIDRTDSNHIFGSSFAGTYSPFAMAIASAI